jgi:3-hydroxyisobutyrate dehydrogenase
MTRVGFIGLGHMGGPMCAHVIEAGFAVAAFDLDSDAVARAAGRGARAATSAADCASGAEILVTSLPGPPQVEQVLLGAGGVSDAAGQRGADSAGGAIAALAPGALVIEMSTSSLEVGRRVLAAARPRSVSLIDAPVAGQTIGAQAGTLAIYVGGEVDALARALPVLQAIGDPDRIFHVGGNGSGYVVKLLLNLTWFMQAVATAETLAVGVRAGVALDQLHAALVHSPANSNFLERDVRMVLDHGDYDDGFPMPLVNKDLTLAVDLAREVGLPVEMTALVEQIHRRARVRYGDDAGELSAIRLYEDLAGIELRWPTSS